MRGTECTHQHAHRAHTLGIKLLLHFHVFNNALFFGSLRRDGGSGELTTLATAMTNVALTKPSPSFHPIDDSIR